MVTFTNLPCGGGKECLRINEGVVLRMGRQERRIEGSWDGVQRDIRDLETDSF